MRLFALLMILLGPPASVRAFECEPPQQWWTPAATADQNAFVIAAGGTGQARTGAILANPHFVDANGGRIAARIEHLGNQIVLRPDGALKGTVQVVVAGWPEKQLKIAGHAFRPPGWTRPPRFLRAREHALGPAGVRWSIVIEAPVKHAGLVHLRLRGNGSVRYLPVKDGKLTIVGGPCGDTLAGIAPGKHRFELRPVGPGGVLGPAQPITLKLPRYR